MTRGARETCLAFAMSDAHAAAIGAAVVAALLRIPVLPREAARQDTRASGTTISAIRAALEHDGQPVETEWPYLQPLPADLKKWKPPAEGRGRCFAGSPSPTGSGLRRDLGCRRGATAGAGRHDDLGRVLRSPKQGRRHRFGRTNRSCREARRGRRCHGQAGKKKLCSFGIAGAAPGGCRGTRG